MFSEKWEIKTNQWIMCVFSQYENIGFEVVNPVVMKSAICRDITQYSALLSNTLSLCSSLNVRDQVSHPHRTN
jgi:hypothetical protein